MLNQEQPTARRIALVALCLAAMLVLACIFTLFNHFVNPYKSDQAILLYDGWTVQTEREKEPVQVEDLREYITLQADEKIILRRVMKEDIPNGSLHFYNYFQWIQIYLNNELIYDNTELSGEGKPVKEICFVTLPDEYAGMELRFEASSPYGIYASSPEPPYLGDTYALHALQTSYFAQSFLLATVLSASGVLFLLFSLFMSIKYPSKIQWGNFCFGIFTILLGLNPLSENAIFLSTLSPFAAETLEMIVWMLYPLPLLLWLFSQFKRCKVPILIIVGVHIVSVGIVSAAVLKGVWALPESLGFLNVPYIFITVATAVLVGVEWLQKNKVIRFISPCMALLVLSAVLSAIDINAFYYAKEWLRIIGLLSLVALMWIYHLREYIARRREEQKNVQMLSVKHSLAAERLDAANRYIRESSAARHEFLHHLTALKALSDENNESGVARYLQKLTEAMPETEPVLYCENVLVNAILCKYAADCRIDSIRLDCDALVEKDLPFAENDLCTLLMNLMDNALEACRNLPPGQRWIRLQIRKKERFLVIACENNWDGSISQPESGVYASTKPDSHLHGFGIPAMRDIAEKYESTLSIHFDGTSFNVSTALRYP